MSTIVAENSDARFGGFLAWGQSRKGGYLPPKGTREAFVAQPSMRNEWIGNHVLEGLRADHQGGPINVSGSFGDPVGNNGNAFAVVTSWAPSFTEGCDVGSAMSSLSCRGMNRNSVDSNGGFQIGASIDVLMEGNQVRVAPGPPVGLNATTSPFQVSKGALGCITRANTQD